MTLILAFGNKARHGKDTAGEAIFEYFERQRQSQIVHKVTQTAPKVKIYKWADSLYQEVNDFLASFQGKRWLDGERVVYQLENTPEVKYMPEWVTPEGKIDDPRAPLGKYPKLLQWWGTEYRRENFGYDYWVDKTMAQILKDNPGIAIITDTRFPNEALATKARGGYTINVTRVLLDGTPYADPSRPADHISEVALDGYNWDFTLRIREGHAAATAELAIALAVYLNELHKKG